MRRVKRYPLPHGGKWDCSAQNELGRHQCLLEGSPQRSCWNLGQRKEQIREEPRVRLRRALTPRDSDSRAGCSG